MPSLTHSICARVHQSHSILFIGQLVYPSTNAHCFNKLKIDFLLRLILENSPVPSFNSIQEKKKLKLQIMLPYKKKTIYYFLKHTQILYKCPSIDEKSEEMYFLYIIMLTSQYTNLFVSFVKSIQRNFFNSMQISSGFLLLAILVQLLSGQWFCCKVRKIGKIQTKTKQNKKKETCVRRQQGLLWHPREEVQNP